MNQIFILHELNMLNNIANSMFVKTTAPSLKQHEVLTNEKKHYEVCSVVTINK